MSHEFEPELNLAPIEAALSSLTPARGAIDRDAIMFRAGQQSMRSRWVWPSATAALALIAVGEAAFFTTRPTPEPRIIERIVEVPAAEHAAPVVILRQNPANDLGPFIDFPTDPEPGRAARQDNYHLREQALRFGVDSLPELPPLASRTDPARDRELFRSEIRSLLDPGGIL
jgi:hypothetical protein